MRPILKKIVFVILIIATGSLFSCQSTPDVQSVQNKDGTELMETILNSSNDSDVSIITSETSWVERVDDNDGTFSCVIDANIDIPNDPNIPVILVSPYEFTVDDFKRMQSVLLSDVELYTYGEGVSPDRILTKDQITSSILNLKANINDPNSNLNQLKEESPENYEFMLQETLDRIDYLESIYDEAPEEVAKEPLVFTEALLKEGFSATNMPYTITNETILEAYSSFKAASNTEMDGRYNHVSVGYHSYDTENKNEVISLDEAIDIANQILVDLDIEDMEVCASSESSSYGSDYYTIYYARTYNGIATTYATQNYTNAMQQETSVYTFLWPYETIKIRLRTDGRFELLNYNAPLQCDETLTEHVELLSFEEIKEIFKKQLVYEGVWTDENIVAREYHINRITLGMMRVSIQNKTDEYMVIPVWDFFGYYVDTYNSQDDTEYALNENNQAVFCDDDPYNSVLTINAIDGSIIDRGLGY